MKAARRYAMVFVTAPDLKTARKLASAALAARLVACANLVPRIESHYWWQGKVERGAEVLCIFKTLQSRVPALEKFVLANHPYDTPEIISVELGQGTPKYLSWLAASVS